MSFIHRSARIEDIPQLVDIYNASIPGRESTCDLEPVSHVSRLAWFAAHDEQRPLWVGLAADDPEGPVLGYLAFSDFLNGRPGYGVTSDLAVYLHPEWRGRSLGSYLLRQALDHAPRLGVETLVTTIFASNTASVRLFEKMGFEHWGYLPKVARLVDIYRDLIIVGRTV